MSLFPAYAAERSENVMEYEVSLAEISSASPALEAQLLASDTDEERDPPAQPAAPAAAAPRDSALDSDVFYLDRKFDGGNLRVSTLYYPGRPQYERQARGVGVGAGAERARARRYWQAGPLTSPARDELAQRTAAYTDMLAERPHDAQLWLTYIHFLERCGEEGSAHVAAERALGAVAHSRRVREAARRLRAALPPQRRLDLLRADVAAADSPELELEARVRVVEEAARRGSPGDVTHAAVDALRALRAHPAAYPRLLHAYGAWARAAGLWESLVLLIELTLAVNLPPDAPAPPRPDLDPEPDARLQLAEDDLVGSGLPLSAVWVRVERMRAAAHWRPAPASHAAAPGADPQRAPLPADVADLVQPARGADAQLLLAVQALRLAGVPVLPGAQYAARALCAQDAQTETGEAMLPLMRAARRLPPAHPARAPPATLRAALHLALDPPHYFTDDDHGFSSWVEALWEAALSEAGGAARVALVCWRLRWVHARALLEEGAGAGARRLRGLARATLKRWARDSPLPYVHFARIELVVGGVQTARRAALHAARAALRDPAAPAALRLYCARALGELDERAGLWATASAALAMPLPDDERLGDVPPTDLLADALRACERECTALEARLAEGGTGAGAVEGAWVRAQVPHDAEWGAARARLAPPCRRAELVESVRRAAAADLEEDALRYWEQSACALAAAASRDHSMVTCARRLAPLFPHDALLALACGGAALWACGVGAEAAGEPSRSHAGALALVLPPLLRALPAWGAGDAARLAAACARATRCGAGGALLAALRLEAEARSPRGGGGGPHAALLAALDAHPNHKWLYVRGATWCPAQAAALTDALLERGLRLHALRDELAPLDLAPLHTLHASQ